MVKKGHWATHDWGSWAVRIQITACAAITNAEGSSLTNPPAWAPLVTTSFHHSKEQPMDKRKWYMSSFVLLLSLFRLKIRPYTPFPPTEKLTVWFEMLPKLWPHQQMAPLRGLKPESIVKGWIHPARQYFAWCWARQNRVHSDIDGKLWTDSRQTRLTKQDALLPFFFWWWAT